MVKFNCIMIMSDAEISFGYLDKESKIYGNNTCQIMTSSDCRTFNLIYPPAYDGFVMAENINLAGTNHTCNVDIFTYLVFFLSKINELFLNILNYFRNLTGV